MTPAAAHPAGRRGEAVGRERSPGTLPFTPEALADARRAIEAGGEAFPTRDEALAHWREECREVVRELAERGGSITLGFSGGTDSRILARTLVELGYRPRLLCLATAETTRDVRNARAAAASLGLPLETALVDDADLRDALASCAAVLPGLLDTTQRVLAVAENLLVAGAMRNGNGTLWTGHGPESILGGFHRRPAPASGEIDRMIASIALNARRLSAVLATRSSDFGLVCPFYEPRLLTALRRLSASGLGHDDLAPGSPAKASLQNGSGIHYRLERMARADGFARLSDWFANRIGETPCGRDVAAAVAG